MIDINDEPVLQHCITTLSPGSGPGQCHTISFLKQRADTTAPAHTRPYAGCGHELLVIKLVTRDTNNNNYFTGER